MPLSYDVSDGVATITLDRPEVLNAIDEELGTELLGAVRQASADDEVRCVVVTGAGRAFSSGEDLGALAAVYERGEPPPLGDTLVNRYNPLIRAIRAAPKPLVAALNGVAAGAGASIALACDFRIASTKAKLVFAFVHVGLVPDSGGMWFLTRMVGTSKALELCTLGDPVDAEEAHRLGLVHEIVVPEEFDVRWREVAARFARGPTHAYALIKQLGDAATRTTLDQQLDLEVRSQTEAGGTEDHLEGVRAFLTKRAPVFKGR